MPRVCKICVHADREAIDRALVAGAAIRGLSALYRVSEDSIARHKATHIPEALAKSQEAKAEAHALDVMGELRRCFERVNLMFDACDRWLRDADDPARYDIGPRAEELSITYLDMLDGKRIRRKATLSHLLNRLEDAGMNIEGWETKRADPRDLVLKTADRLRLQTELLAKLLGELNEQPQINVLVAPEWLQVRSALLGALAPYPEARASVAERLLTLEAGK
jgi:hypothetical protein